MKWSGPSYGTNWKYKVDQTSKQLLHNHHGKEFLPQTCVLEIIQSFVQRKKNHTKLKTSYVDKSPIDYVTRGSF